MAGSLIKIDEEIVTTAVASVTLTGIDSTYDVYMVKFFNAQNVTNNTHLDLYVATSGTPDTTANYDYASKRLRTNTTFNNDSTTNATTGIRVCIFGGIDSYEIFNGICYLFNWNNASEYSFTTFETTFISENGTLFGSQGGGVHTVAQSNNSLVFKSGSGNIDSGTFTLYGLKK